MKTLTYEEARPLITSGDPLFFSHGNIGGWVIQFFTLSKFTHMAVVAPPRGGRLMAFEAVVFGGVKETPLSQMGDFYWFPVDRPLSEKALKFAMSHIGCGYSFFDCFLGWFGVAQGKNMRWQCTEYGKGIERENGWQLSTVDTPHRAFDEFCELGFDPIFVKSSCLEKVQECRNIR